VTARQSRRPGAIRFAKPDASFRGETESRADFSGAIPSRAADYAVVNDWLMARINHTENNRSNETFRSNKSTQSIN